ncbi:MAG: hypothetical protein WC360_08075 [Opitutales bacterium]|jgi:ABC-type transporter Mla subunit MlaD
MTGDSLEGTQFVGAVLMALSSLMGAYYLTLRIRAAFAAQSDPKADFATRTELERLRSSLDDARRDCGAGRQAVEERTDDALASVHELIRRNAEHIAVLIARSEMFERRIAEAVGRIDRISERLGRQG